MNTLRLHFIQQRECTLRDSRQLHQNRNDEKAAVRKNGRIVGLHVGGGGAPGCGGSWTGGSSLWPPGCLLSGAHLTMLGQNGCRRWYRGSFSVMLVSISSCYMCTRFTAVFNETNKGYFGKNLPEQKQFNMSVTIVRVLLILSCWHLQCIGR